MADFQATSAGDLSADCLTHETTERCQERKKFSQLLHQFSQELRAIQDQNPKSNNRVKGTQTIFEVFCGQSSQLSHQCQQLGMQAVRFSRDRCDLQSAEGRQLLFHDLVHQEPRHVWFSPSCGPWSGWSNINGTKSIEHWEQLHRNRLQHIEQIALGMVILRFQISLGHHFHWEQPRTSLMLRLPYLCEAYQCLRNLEVDLCVAGNLCDPVSGKPIKKALTILTTSPILVDQLSHLRCPGNHEHQIIEGTTRYKGENVNRSTFTENYPRRFARRIALCFRKSTTLRERSSANLPWAEIPILGADGDTDPAAKRRRIASQARLKLSRVSEASTLQNPKRSRCIGKTQPVDSQGQWEKVFSEIFQNVPRVGKIVVDQPELLKTMQSLLPGDSRQVVCAVASRGTSRTVAPPNQYTPGEIHSRISVFTDRVSGKLFVEESWEDIVHLSKRQMIRPSHAGHRSITVFACNTPAIRAELNGPRSSHPEETPGPNPIAYPAGTQELTESQRADLENIKQPESFKQLTKEEQQAIVRIHKNLGHPNPERLSTLLRQQGFRAEVARAAGLPMFSVFVTSQTQTSLSRNYSRRP